MGEQPLFCLFSSDFRGAHDGAQMLAARQAAKMLEADPGQSGDLFLCEDLLTRLNGDHFCPSPLRSVQPFRFRQKLQSQYVLIYSSRNHVAVSGVPDLNPSTDLQMT